MRRSLNKTITIIIVFYVAIAFMSCSTANTSSMKMKKYFDFEAHRGGRGLMPENTIAAMMNAVDLGVTTLEMDVVISKDQQVLVSHDLYFNDAFTTTPTGEYITKEQSGNYLLYNLPYDSIRKYDVGLKPHPLFPTQKKMPAYKPLLIDLIDAVEQYAKSKGRQMKYNIEIKSKTAYDNIRHPGVSAFAELVMKIVNENNLANRTIIQSFDVRPLQYIHQHYPAIRLSYLVENSTLSLQSQLDVLGFIPAVYSPEHIILNKAIIDKCHQQHIKVIPWTVNTLDEMNKLVEMGVDGIISDYPNLFAEVKLPIGANKGY